MKIEIKNIFIYVNRGVFVIILILLAIGALIPDLLDHYRMHDSSSLYIDILNQDQSYFYLCVALAFGLSLVLAIVGLVNKVIKKQTYEGIMYGILGIFLSLFALGSLVSTYFGLNLH